ncbi:PAS domain S-box protein [Halorarius litoreus]|uniref:PAS domain S-box protein n=1 Tax=Halorarius litoreus TaxID=2962676 RepID=UPI0020CEFB73|nr:PAS domain S-box protein [Halorarius litoreus]
MGSTGQSAVYDEDERPDRGDVRVLHLDDSDAFLELTATKLERDGFDVVSLSDPHEALDRLDEVDCVVSDYQMPPMDGIEFLERVREDYPDLPFLLFTGKGSEDIAGRAVSAGVTDYLQKLPGDERFTLLANRIENTVAQYRAEKRAEETDRRIREVHERVSDAVVALDTDWRYTYVNGHAEELLGVDEGELLGTSVFEAFPDLEDSEFEAAFREALQTREQTAVEAYNEDTDAWYEARAYPDEDGLSIYFRDVTERRERERRHEAIFNQTYQFTGLMEPDGTLVEANETALAFGGLDREDVVGKKVWEAYWFQHGDAATVARAFVDRAASGEFVRTDLDVQGADGVVTIDFSVRPVTDETGEVVLLIPEGRDITELKERERDLREERAFTESIFQTMSDPLYAFDEQGEFLRWNDQFETVTGYDADEIEAMTPLEFVPDDEAETIAENIATVFREDVAVTVESYFETKSGERIPYEFTGAQLKGEDDETLGLVGVGRDISDRKQRERELRRQNERLEEFASVLSHDLRNRLSVASGSLSLLDAEGEHVERARQALTRMEQLIDDVLRLAEQGQVVDETASVSLTEAVEEAVENVVFDDDVTVRTAFPPARRILADRQRFAELVENLLVNAVEHGSTSPRSQAREDAVEHGDETVTIEVGIEGDTLYVADDGPGIPRPEREEVFTAGYSTSNGSGFGLAIVTTIAEAHGWTVSATESELGGARIEVSGIESPADQQ